MFFFMGLLALFIAKCICSENTNDDKAYIAKINNNGI